MSRPTQFEKMRANRVKLDEARERALKDINSEAMRMFLRARNMEFQARFADGGPVMPAEPGGVVELAPIKLKPWWRFL